MKFEEIDVTTLKSGLIAHGVNRQLAMGAGIAGALSKKWPKVREQYLTRKKPVPKLGSVDLVELDRGLYVANCYTQESFGHDSKRYASADAVALCLSKVLLLSARLGGVTVHVPRIGCDLGGLDWPAEVRPLFQQEEDYFNDLLVDQSSLTRVELVVVDVPNGKWGGK